MAASTASRGTRPQLVLISAVLGASLAYVGASIVNVALPTLQRVLGADATQLQWIVSGYNLAIAALLLSAGAFADRFGHYRTFRAGLVTYAMASAICACATRPEMLIAGRLLQGIAAALLVPSSLGLVTTNHEPADRAHAVSLWSSFSAVGAGMGPLVGGMLIDNAAWPFVFWMNLPVVAVAWWLLTRAAPVAAVVNRAHTPFHWRSASLAILALGSGTYALIESAAKGLTDPWCAGMAAASIICAWRFVRYQQHPDAALIPISVFRSRNFTMANVATFLAYCAIGGGFYVMMLTWIDVQGYSATAAGAITLPFMLMTAGLAQPVGRIVRRFGPKLPLALGMSLLGLGFLTWIPAEVGTSFWLGYMPGVVLTATGIGLFVGPVTSVVVGDVDVSLSGVASGINSAVARSATLLSVAALGAVHFASFDNAAQLLIADIDLTPATTAALHAELIHLTAAEIPAHVPTATRLLIESALDQAFLHATRKVAFLAGSLAIAAALIAFIFIGGTRSASHEHETRI